MATFDSETEQKIQAIVAEVLELEDFTRGGEEVIDLKYQMPFEFRFRGKLKLPSEPAFARLEDGLRGFGLLPFLRATQTGHMVLAVEEKPSNPSTVRVNLLLMVFTALSVLFMGAFNQLTYDGVVLPGTDKPDIWYLSANWYVLSHFWRGWPFALGLLSILTAHEFGHYFAARFHKAKVSLPYFIPLLLPFQFNFLGTMGAVINMRRPVRNRKVLFDIGAAGPWAGFLVALPVLWIGISLSRMTIIPESNVTMEGNPLIYLLIKWAVHGQLLPHPQVYSMPPFLHWLSYWLTSHPSPVGALDINMHPVAWAGWGGLLITAMNLFPIGQLDGGHAAYVLFGKRAELVGRVASLVLVGLGVIYNGWWFWAILTYFLVGFRPALLLDDITPLDARRRWQAWATLGLFFLVFTPIPLLQF